MFEKEAKEYREEWQNKGYYFVSQEMEQIELDDIVDATFKDGAEFGYNKGFEFGVKSNEKVNQIVDNEWHKLDWKDILLRSNYESNNYFINNMFYIVFRSIVVH